MKAGGPCPEPLCQGKLYDTQAPRKDVELKAQPPIQATVYERQMLRCAGCQKTFTAFSQHGVAAETEMGQVLIFLSNLRTVPRARLSC